jgi:hypothetical protein
MGGDEVQTSELLALRNGGNGLSKTDKLARLSKRHNKILTAAIVIESRNI